MLDVLFSILDFLCDILIFFEYILFKGGINKMYYPSYEDYMKDVFYFNGLANPNNMYPYSGFSNQNLSDFYPSIYKIVNPVVQKVISRK